VNRGWPRQREDHQRLRYSRKLHERYEAEWALPLTPFIEDWVWERGFIGKAKAKFETFIPNLSTIAALTPLQDLSLGTVRRDEFGKLAEHPMARGLRNLSASVTLEADTFASTNWEGLRSLMLYSTGGDEEMISLARSPLPALQRLSLSQNQCTDVGFEALSRSQFFSQLTALTLSGRFQPGVESYERIATGATSLQRLSLTPYGGGIGLEVLEAGSALAALTELTIGTCTDAQVQLLFESPRLPKLQVITRRTETSYERVTRPPSKGFRL
jgi:hypothetical protein